MIELEGLTFSYRRDDPVINDLTWSFPSGSLTALSGPSGTGKSTLLYLIGLLLNPLSGSIKYQGEDMTMWSDMRRSQFRASQVGFVFQDAALDPTRTVLDNVVESSNYSGMPRSKASARAMELLRHFEVDLRAEHKPGQVSGGQAQRIAMCRALLADPQLILADEPTGNLDAATTRIVIGALSELAEDKKRTVIIATHDREIVAGCHRVVRL